MSKSMFVAHFSFAHSCCLLCAISGVNYYAISAFDSNPRFRSQKLIPTSDFDFVFAFYDVAFFLFQFCGWPAFVLTLFGFPIRRLAAAVCARAPSLVAP